MKNEPRGELARYAYGFSDKKPGRLFWAIHACMVIFILWMLFSTAHAEVFCDFEHQCYDGGADGGRQLAPRAPGQTGRPPTLPSQQAPVCHLMNMREGPMTPFRVVELCSMPPEEEAELHKRAAREPPLFGGLQ